MRKLLSAYFARLRKDRFFWVLLIVVAAVSVIGVLSSVQAFEAQRQRGFETAPETYAFAQAPLMGLFCALFSSMFLGTEYSDGTIRNKLIVGHRRNQVYLANYLLCFVVCLCFLGVWLVICALGLFRMGPMDMGLPGYGRYVLVAVGFTASFAALFACIGTLSTNKAMTVIYSLTIFLALLMLSSAIYDRLNEVELLGGVAYLDGAFVEIPASPNPRYISGSVRTFWECVLDFLPTGQALLMNEVEITHPLRQVLFSLLLTGLLLLGGMAAFRRKDLK